MRQIINLLPKGTFSLFYLVQISLVDAFFSFTENRQSMLFSATQTTKVTDLARMSLRPGPLYINVDSHRDTSTADNLEQGYVVCDSDKRFLLLFTFLRKNLKKKVIVFFSSCKSVQYHGELLNYIDVPVLDLHVRPLFSPLPSLVSKTLELIVIPESIVDRVNKSNKSEPTLSSNSVTPLPESSSAPTSPLVDSIYQRSIGSFNSTLLMILETTFIESDEPLVLERMERVCCSCYRVNWVS